jgi:uncharacterized RDD family membrane protein YckC
VDRRQQDSIAVAKTAADARPELSATVTDPAAAGRNAPCDGRRRSAPDDESPDPIVGQRLAHFVVERRLGAGGMAKVYLATDLALDRSVALKVLTRDIAARADLRERFYREARAQARIQHPNVAHIYYIGEQDGLVFFAMEYIEGETVQQLLDRLGRVPPDRALDICRMAALGLREGQRYGFTHRDVKPSNLMIDRHGVVKVLDFGLVKETAGRGAAQPELTEERTLLGTPLYVAPEQARGDAVDFRADIYALGVTLHHLVAGQPPFAGPNAMAIISQHLADQRPRLQLPGRDRRLGAGLNQLCDRMMAKQPESRFPCYDDLIVALERLSTLHTRPAGFWVRMFAVLFDGLILTILLVPFGMVVGDLTGNMLALAVLPYSILLTARYGKTLGKRVLEIEVTPADQTGPVGLRRSAVRFLVQQGPSYMLFGGAEVILLSGADGYLRLASIVMVVLAVAVPVLFGLATIMSPGKRALWDRLAGTQVRYVTKR